MALFDIELIGRELLSQPEIVWFRDIPDEQKKLSDAVKARICRVARRWEGYDHKPYGDSYGEFLRNRNRCNFEDLYINRRNALADFAFYEIFIGDGKYIEEIERMIRMICSEVTWCVPAHAGIRAKDTGEHVIELYAAETCAVLAITGAFLRDRLNEDTVALIERRIDERMFVPYTETDGYGWMGTGGKRVNNWNPWINSNVLLCASLACRDRDKYRMLVKRACALTENYVNSLSEDCLCDEGVRYWHLSGACLFDFAEILYDLTAGKVDITGARQIKDTCSYMAGMYDEYGLPANYADATIDFYPDAPLLVRAGERTGNNLLSDMGRALYRVDRLRELHDNFYRQMKNIYTASRIQPLDRVVYPEFTLLRGINVCAMRKNGFFASFKANHNGESHNHNDAGSFVIYHEGTPVFIDPGVDLYSGFTFSEWRSKLWYMRSEYHSLPVIRGKSQGFGGKFAATPLKTGDMRAETEISGAYDGEVASWTRSMDFSGDSIVITDRSADASESELHYMLAEMPQVNENTLTFSCGVKATLEGVRDIRIEQFDITGKNPPDGIIGDAPNRITDGYSVLIPRLFIKQWKRETLYRLICTPVGDEVTLTVSMG
ncbi:MAG: heparinase II/III-family protein [Clostridia bacterium]|nr:heparinase II/III-family protein [Clostridia bacterium]